MSATPLDIERLELLIAERFPGARAQIDPIPAGLGDRRFYRIGLDSSDESAPNSVVARVEPGPLGTPANTKPFTWLPEPALEPIRTVLEDAGLPVPRSYLHHAELGIDLLEDVGNRTLADTVGEEQRTRYHDASALIDRLQSVHGSPQIAPAFGRHFGADLICTKAEKIIHWSFPGLLDREATASERESIQTGFESIAQLVDTVPRVLSHRDFKAENLHLVASNSGPAAAARCVMIDVQGAFMAPPEYDRVCLLRDLQVDLPESLVEEIAEQALSTLPDAASRAASRSRFDALAVVRLGKDVAHIVDAGRSRGDVRRWHEIPKGLELLDSSLVSLQSSFPAARELNCVMHALTRAAHNSDIQSVGESESR